MENTKTLVLGYFGNVTDQQDGQTIKTRNIYELLKRMQNNSKAKVSYFDTQSLQVQKYHIFTMFWRICRTDLLIYMPAHKSLNYLFPLIFILSYIFRSKIHLVVVGGWLGEFMKKRPFHTYLLGKISGIYPQTKELCEILKQNFNFRNVHQLDNFRIVDLIHEPQKSEDHSLTKLVFMARVHPQKGINTIFNLAIACKSEKINVEIDLYGPIYKPFEENFKKELMNHENIFYKGILKQNEIHSTLQQYDLMLFPTQFYTEGFPGSLLDSFISGVPAIVTRWKYADEFIYEHHNGIMAKFGDEEDFIYKTISLLKDPLRIQELRSRTFSMRNKYTFETAWNVLNRQLYLKDR